MKILQHIVDAAKGKIPIDRPRSTKWPAARAKHLKENPTCIICGGTDKLEVHHIEPFHKNPEKELDPANFATLCESDSFGVNCHLWGGHLGNFKSWNIDIISMAKDWLTKFKNRPLVEK